MNRRWKLFWQRARWEIPLLAVLQFPMLAVCLSARRHFGNAEPVTLAQKVDQLCFIIPRNAILVVFLVSMVGIFLGLALFFISMAEECQEGLRRPEHVLLSRYLGTIPMLLLSCVLGIVCAQSNAASFLATDTAGVSLARDDKGAYKLAAKETKGEQAVIERPAIPTDSISQEDFAAVAGRIPELATRWGYQARAPVKPFYLCHLRWLGLLASASAWYGAALLLRLPFVWLWRWLRGTLRRYRNIQSAEPARQITELPF